MSKNTLTFGQRIGQLRERAKLSVQALAKLAGLSRQAIYDIEAGKRPDPQWSSVQALADALGVGVETLREK